MADKAKGGNVSAKESSTHNDKAKDSGRRRQRENGNEKKEKLPSSIVHSSSRRNNISHTRSDKGAKEDTEDWKRRKEPNKDI